MQKTGIEYLDYTWNPIAMRCTPVSPGCVNCWHLRTATRLKNNPGLPDDERAALAGTGPLVMRKRDLGAPLKVKKAGVFGVQFMGDLFHESMTERINPHYIAAIYGVASCCPEHTFLILTKRPHIMLDWHTRYKSNYANWIVNEACQQLPQSSTFGIRLKTNLEWPLPNVWHGLTVCNQAEADEKIPIFLQVPGKKFLSIEPMLGPIDLTPPDNRGTNYNLDNWTQELDLVILGGETGPGARPLHPDWARQIRDKCERRTDMGRPWPLPFFFKQWGEYLTSIPSDEESAKSHRFEYGESFYRVGRNKAGRLLDRHYYNELPWVK